MWWREVHCPRRAPQGLAAEFRHRDASAEVATGAILDSRAGPVIVGPRTRICRGAHIIGPVIIGADCLIGNYAMIRGTTRIGDGTRIGFASEVKNAIIGEQVMIGPQCFVADSVIEDEAYLGAQVRTSNHRLDRRTVEVMLNGVRTDTGQEKLGCLIGKGAALGIQVVILPGREIAPGSVFGPRIIVEKNLPAGRYRLPQQLETY